MKKKNELIGLTPDKFPKVADFKLKKFLDKTSIPESFTGKKRLRFGLKKMLIQDSKLDNFQRIIFALARQIPSNQCEFCGNVFQLTEEDFVEHQEFCKAKSNSN